MDTQEINLDEITALVKAGLEKSEGTAHSIFGAIEILLSRSTHDILQSYIEKENIEELLLVYKDNGKFIFSDVKDEADEYECHCEGGVNDLIALAKDLSLECGIIIHVIDPKVLTLSFNGLTKELGIKVLS